MPRPSHIGRGPLSASCYRKCIDHLWRELGVSERRACRTLAQPHSSQRKAPPSRDNSCGIFQPGGAWKNRSCESFSAWLKIELSYGEFSGLRERPAMREQCPPMAQATLAQATHQTKVLAIARQNAPGVALTVKSQIGCSLA